MGWFRRKSRGKFPWTSCGVEADFVLTELTQVLLATNRDLLAQNRDLHNRLAVRFPAEFHQYLQAEQVETAKEDRVTEGLPTVRKPREPEPPMPEQILMDGRAGIIPQNVNELISDRKKG